MPQIFLYNLLLLTVPNLFGIDLTNPLVLLLLFLTTHVLAGAVAGLILVYAGLPPDDELPLSSYERRLIFYLYPLYPIFFRPSQFGLGEYAVWAVFFMPVFEEIMFFAMPSLYGFVTGDFHMAFAMGLICGTFWIIIHLFRMANAWLYAGYSLKQIALGLLAGLIVFVPSCIVSSMLWVSGLGVVSILFHSTYNGLVVLGKLARLSSRPVSRIKHAPRKYYRIRKRKYYIIRELEDI